MKKGKLIVFSAPSGSGKTTIVKHLLQQKELNLEFSISATSRQKRGDEIDAKDYYFLSAKEFKTKNTASFTATTNVVLPDGGIVQSYGDMGYWESGEKYPATDPVRYNNGSIDLCGMPIRHHKIPNENTLFIFKTFFIITSQLNTLHSTSMANWI